MRSETKSASSVGLRPKALGGKRKKSIILFLCSCIFIASGVAGSVEAKKKKLKPAGEILPSTIKELKASFKPDKKNQILIDAALTNKLNDIAVNYEVIKKHNFFFSHEIETGKATDQKQSGRCWLFAGLNVLRPTVIKKLELDDFEFSQTYLYFWDKIEKSNVFLEKAIELADEDVRSLRYQSFINHPIYDGGWWSYFANLVEKYGVAPKSAMPETVSSENSKIMNNNINLRLKKAALKIKNAKSKGASEYKLYEIKKEELKKIYKMLVFHLGVPPEKFEFRYKAKQNLVKEYTPVEFAKDFVFDDLDKYVILTNYPSRKTNTTYVLDNEGAQNIIGGKPETFLNVDIATMKNITLRSVLTDSPVWFAASMPYDIDHDKGIMNSDLYKYSELYNINLKSTKKTTTLTQSVSTDHAMTIIGVDVKKDKVIKWKVENSWGKNRGKDGFYAMYDNWFDDYVLEVVVKKSYLTLELLEALKQEPILIKWNEPVP